MANTSTRTLRLLSLLQTHRYWPGTELAERLGVSARTLRRDIDRLRELGYPIEAQRGAAGGYQLAAGAALPPLVIDDEEAVALVVGLRIAAQGAVEGIAEASVRMLAKVAQVMPARLRSRAEALRAMTVPADWGLGPPRAAVDPAVLTALALACRDSEQLRFAYTAADGRRTERLVEPHRLVCPGRRWYLVAYDLSRHDWRSFRADRLTAPAATGTCFRPRELPAADAAAFVRAGLEAMPRAYDVTALVHAPAGAVRERLGRWGTVEEAGADRCRVRVTAHSLDWPAVLLASLDADFRVLGPPEFRTRLSALADRFTRALEPPEAPPEAPPEPQERPHSGTSVPPTERPPAPPRAPAHGSRPEPQ